jgi:hypothetical protein
MNRPTGRPSKLPEASVLLSLREAGASNADIAEQYQVTPAAVSKRFATLGQYLRPIRFRETLPWPVATEHRALYAAQRLRSHLKARSGIELAPRERKLLDAWYARLQQDGTVLDYTPVAVGNPWLYVPRETSDAGLLIRWPVDAGAPTPEQRRLLGL